MTEYYKVILDCWRREIQNEGIQPLPDGFYSSMSQYSQQLKEQVKTVDKETLKGKIIEKEREHVEKMLNDLNRLRLRKLIVSELDGVAVDHLNLTLEEKKLQVELRRLQSSHTQSIRQILLGKDIHEDTGLVAVEPPAIRAVTKIGDSHTEKTQLTLKVVRFLQPLPAIMGVDMKTYGPFKAEDVASLPAQNAENLIRKGIAKMVETEP